jgi:hypothetical protein
MKLFISTMLCIGILHQLCSGQTVVDYDWQKGEFTRPFPDSIKERSMLSIRYLHINRFAFGFNNTVFTPINREFLDGADKLSAGMDLLLEKQAEAAAEKKTTDEVAKRVKGKALVANQKAGSFWTEKSELLGRIEIAFHTIEDAIIGINEIMSLETPIKQAWNDPGIYDADAMSKRIFGLVGGVDKPADIITQTTATVRKITDALSDINSLIAKLDGLPEKHGQDLTPTQQKSHEALIAALKKRKDELAALYSGNNLKILQNNAAALFDKSTMLLNANFQSLPRNVGTAEGDFFQVHDEIRYNEGKSSFTIDQKLKTYGGTRVDFSVGLAMNIGGNGSDYSLRKNPTDAETGADTANVILFESRRNKLFQFSPVILVHWYQTSHKNVQLMLTTGVAPDFSTLANSRLFLGASLGLPASNNLTRRLVLSAGVSAGYADELKSDYRDWKSYKRFTDVKNEDLTTKVVRPGGFFSITYNLGGVGHESKSSGK